MTSKRTLRLAVEYDGAAFHGWQVQKTVRSVQGEIEEALRFVLQHPVHLAAAGRTDAGCHALAQVASFKTPSPLSAANLLGAVNGLTGSDICVHALEEAAPSFHARWSARWRDYSYVLARNPSALLRDRVYVPSPWPDPERLAAAAALVVGTKDFIGLCNRSTDNRRPVCAVHRVAWEEWSGGLVFRIRADHFLYKMVRTLVGTCVEIGRGRWGVDRMEEILKTGDRRLAAPPAPSGGLYFTGVGYEPEWEPAAAPLATPWWGATRPLALFEDTTSCASSKNR